MTLPRPVVTTVLGFVKSYAKYLEVDISTELSEISLSDSDSLKNRKKQNLMDKDLKKFTFFLLFLILLLTVLFFFK